MSQEQGKVRLFREKSLEAIESPEKLNDYLRVTDAGVWLVLAAVIALLAGFVLWGIFGSIDTTVNMAVEAENGVSVVYVPYEKLDAVMEKGYVTLDNGDTYRFDTAAPISVKVLDETQSAFLLRAGGFSAGDVTAVLTLKGAPGDGVYSASAVTERLKPISLLFK